MTDDDAKRQNEALQQLLDKINNEEEIPWGKQFINACMLHPTKNEDGDIEDVSTVDCVLHFFSCGWKLLFAIVPPPHMANGIPCFIVAISFIGVVTYVVG